MVNLNDAYEIARYIKEVEKKTPVKVYVNTDPYNFESTDEITKFLEQILFIYLSGTTML